MEVSARLHGNGIAFWESAEREHVYRYTRVRADVCAATHAYASGSGVLSACHVISRTATQQSHVNKFARIFAALSGSTCYSISRGKRRTVHVLNQH